MNVSPSSLPLPPSLWAATARPAPATPPLEESRSADVAIVGAGFSGLAAALRLAESGASVVVLEAGEPGWGASGRNGGQVIPGLKWDPDELVARFGTDAGEHLARVAGGAPDTLFDLIERHAIDCEAKRCGWIQPQRLASQSMAWRSIRSNSVSGAPPATRARCSPASVPNRATSSSGSHLRPGITWPPLRPDAPQPGSPASSTTTEAPDSARRNAAASPEKPAPTIATSALRDSSSGGVAGAGRAVAAHSEGGNGSDEGDTFMVDPLDQIGCVTRRRKSCVRSCCGALSIARAAPCSTILPPSMKTARSATSRANPISCVTTIIVRPSSASRRITASTSPTSALD